MQLKNRLHIAIGLSLFEKLDIATEKCLESITYCKDFDITIQIERAFTIAEAKNKAINNGFSTVKYQHCLNADYTVVIDNGVIFTINEIKQLISHDVDVACPINKTNENDDLFLSGLFSPYEGMVTNSSRLPKTIKGLKKVDWVNSGIFVIKNSSFRKLEFPWFRYEQIEYWDSQSIEHKYLSDENIGFCLVIKWHNEYLHCDTNCKISYSKSFFNSKSILPRNNHTYTHLCPICLWKGVSFTNLNVNNDELNYDVECPHCLSASRQRLLALYLKSIIDTNRQTNILHIAPSRCEKDSLSMFKNHINYSSIDIDLNKQIGPKSLKALNSVSSKYDIIICSHVLEHIDNDFETLKEFYRILDNNGTLLILVPLNKHMDKTYEDNNIIKPEYRHKAFWHPDHKRLYGNDFSDRLENIGFDVTIDKFHNKLSEDETKLYGIYINEPIFICKKKI